MAEITTRGIPDETKRHLMAQAGFLGVTLNEYCKWLFEEAVLPYDELWQSLTERAEEVERRRMQRGRVILPYDDVPKPDTTTQPFQGERWNKRK